MTGRWTFVAPSVHRRPARHADLIETDPGAVISQAYDLVWNGWELGSGSIRIHDQEIQKRVFRAIGLEDDEPERSSASSWRRCGWARRRTAGSRWGSSDSAALLAGEPNIREVVAFPKVASGSDPLSGAPSEMPGRISCASSESRLLPPG